MKSQEKVARWLEKRLRAETTRQFASFACLFMLGAAVMFVTFWMVYAAIFVAFHSLLPHSHETRMIITALFVVGLFIGNATTDRRYLQSLSFSSGTFQRRPVTLVMPGGRSLSTINPLAPDSAHSFVKIITDALYSGPRCLVAAFRCLRQALKFRTAGADRLVSVVVYLARKDERVSLEELADGVIDPREMQAVFLILQEIRCISLIAAETPQVALRPEAARELERLVRVARKKRQMAEEEEAE